MFMKKKTTELPTFDELAEEYARIKRHIREYQARLKEIEELLESTGRLHIGEPKTDDKWELPPFKVTFYSRVNVIQAEAGAFLREYPEYWTCFEQKITARKPKLLKAYEGAPPDLRKELNQVFELVPAKPRFSLGKEGEKE